MYSTFESEDSSNYDVKIPQGVSKGRVLYILICYLLTLPTITFNGECAHEICD